MLVEVAMSIGLESSPLHVTTTEAHLRTNPFRKSGDPSHQFQTSHHHRANRIVKCESAVSVHNTVLDQRYYMKRSVRMGVLIISLKRGSVLQSCKFRVILSLYDGIEL